MQKTLGRHSLQTLPLTADRRDGLCRGPREERSRSIDRRRQIIRRKWTENGMLRERESEEGEEGNVGVGAKEMIETTRISEAGRDRSSLEGAKRGPRARSPRVCRS